MIWLKLIPIKAYIAAAAIAAILGGIWVIRSDAAKDALRDAYTRFNEQRLTNIEEDKDADNEVDNLSADCLVDAALNGLRGADCPAEGD